jgi:RecB family exonuclease
MPPFSISPLARQHAPWSFSKMETAESCPAQFRHKVILKTAAAPAPSDTKVGIVAHEILERRVQGKPASEARRTAVEKTPLTTQEREMLKLLDESMDDFLQRFDTFCTRQGVTKILCEEEWGFTEAYVGTGFFAEGVYFRGKMDLGALTRDQDLFLIDHKSGIAKPLERDQKKRQQLQSYAVLALANMPGIAGVRGGIHFMQGSPDLRLQWSPYIPAERIRDLFAPWLFKRIDEAASNLTEPFEARPSRRWPCAWCAYQAHCPEFLAMQERYAAQG